MTSFVDTYALVAWLNAKDPDHLRVSQFFDHYEGICVTTEWVLVELANAFSSPVSRTNASEFLKDVRTVDSFEVIPSTPDTFESGIELYSSRPDKAWSLTDCLSFVVMTARGISDALTADRHFAQAGFNPIFAQP